MSQLLTLYTTPVVYLYLDRLRLRRREERRDAAPRVALAVLAAACTVGRRITCPPAPVPRHAGYKEPTARAVAASRRRRTRCCAASGGRCSASPSSTRSRTGSSSTTRPSSRRSRLTWRRARRSARRARSYFPTVTDRAERDDRTVVGQSLAVTQSARAASSPWPAADDGRRVGAGRGGRRRQRFTTYDAAARRVVGARSRSAACATRSARRKYNAQVSAADLESQRLLEQATLAQTYFQIRGQDALQELLDATVAADARDLRAHARRASTTGIDTEIAAVQAEQTLQAARVQATNAGILRAQYEHAIATLLGVPATDFSIPRRAMLGERAGDPDRARRRTSSSAGPTSPPPSGDGRRRTPSIGIGYAAYYPTLTLSGERRAS